MLIGIVGNPKQLIGNGKTLFLTWLLTKANIMGLPIFANYSLNPPIQYTKINTLEDLKNIKNAVVGLDEFWIWADSRRALSKKNILVTTNMLQSRKNINHIIYTVQDFGQIDNRIRAITEILIVVEKVYKQIIEGEPKIIIRAKFLDKSLSVRNEFDISLGKYCSLYNTNEIIEPI